MSALVEAINQRQARIDQINTEIDELQATVQALKDEKVTLKSDIDDLRAYLLTKGIQA